jgi:heme/copper-type cytochrome/quinol oxidase subunit 1
MAVIDTTPEHEAPAPGAPEDRAPSDLERALGTGDHTSIGRLYIGFSLFFVLLSLIARMLVALDLATDNGILGGSLALITQSGLLSLVLLGALPFLLGIAMLVVPLQIGSPTVAFPRAAALSLWSWVVFGGIFILSAVLDGGVGGNDLEAATLGNVAIGAVMVSLSLGAVCVATTVLSHRPAGLTLARVPLFSWSMLVAASVWIASFGAAIAWSVISHLESASAADFLTNFTSGLGWLLRGPAVYMLAIPVLGIAGDVVVTALGRPVRRYGVLQGLIAAFAVLSFGAWSPSVEAVETVLWALFALGATVVLIGFLGGLVTSIYNHTVRLTPALVGVLLGLGSLLVATVLGLLMTVNTAGSDTVFGFDVVALGEAQTIFVVTAMLTAGFGGLFHWSVKAWGSPTNTRSAERALMAIAVGGFVLGLTWAANLFENAVDGTTALPVFGGLMALGALLMVIGVALGFSASSRSDAETVEDPFGGLTLEWQTPSPAVGGIRTADLPTIESPFPLYSGDPEAKEAI